jgi:hypothetical protein
MPKHKPVTACGCVCLYTTGHCQENNYMLWEDGHAHAAFNARHNREKQSTCSKNAYQKRPFFHSINQACDRHVTLMLFVVPTMRSLFPYLAHDACMMHNNVESKWKLPLSLSFLSYTWDFKEACRKEDCCCQHGFAFLVAMQSLLFQFYSADADKAPTEQSLSQAKFSVVSSGWGCNQFRWQLCVGVVSGNRCWRSSWKASNPSSLSLSLSLPFFFSFHQSRQ